MLHPRALLQNLKWLAFLGLARISRGEVQMTSSRIILKPFLIWLVVLVLISVATVVETATASDQKGGVPISIGSQRELFVDYYLIDKLEGVSLKLHEPHPAGTAIAHDDPWEQPRRLNFFTTVLRDGDICRMYYDSQAGWIGYAESPDGVHWTKPRLGLVEFEGSTANNIMLKNAIRFVPFLDTRPGVPTDERFKANAVGHQRDVKVFPRSPHLPSYHKPHARGVLFGYVSSDGIRWRKLRDEPIVTSEIFGAFDSQNVMFWSEVEQKYVLYARHFQDGRRATMRAVSDNFLDWTQPTPMTYSDTGSTIPSANLYTPHAEPYFRAPHIYLSLPGRIFFADTYHILREDDIAAARQKVVSPELRRFVMDNLPPHRRLSTGSAGDHADAVLLSTRAGSTQLDFIFLESFIRPGIGLENWTTRTNYPAYGFIQTSPTEISLYVQRHFAQATGHVQRMTLRLDGFASVHAPYAGGQMVTKPLTFRGRQLEINYSTSAAGSIRVELQRGDGSPITGYSLAECVEMTGDSIEQMVQWRGKSNLNDVSGQSIRLKFAMKDADLYSLRFRE